MDLLTRWATLDIYWSSKHLVPIIDLGFVIVIVMSHLYELKEGCKNQV
jgi:hypothetical protein